MPTRQISAVEWLEEIYLTTGIDRNVHFNQAKAMEKEQMDKALTDRYTMGDLTFEEYYNKIYKTL